jgi:tripartite-type tricarboxylate transporter receptor subunit TctC
MATFRKALACAIGFGLTGIVYAQGYPAKPVRMIVAFAPGGSTDTVTRALVQKLAPALGQSILVDNRPGAGGNVGTEIVAKSPPDGYTLLMAAGSHAINATLYPKLPFDSVRDFEPVALVCTVTGILVAHPSLPVRSARDLIALARAHRGEINFASAGVGTVTHLAGELFKFMAKIDMVHIAYRGSGPALNDLLGGQVSVMFANMPGTIQHVHSGRLRILAVNDAVRSALLPDVPTVAESGLPGYSANTWFGVLAPAKIASDIVQRINREIVRALGAPDLRERLAVEGAVVAAGSPEQFAAFLRSEVKKWADTIRAAGVRVN